MKRSRVLNVNWQAVDGAAHSRRKLILRSNEENMYTCPVKLCLHADFKSSRGLRKHIDIKHPWFYFFDDQPEVKREEMEVAVTETRKANTMQMPDFSITEGMGLEFLNWLHTSCGGGKTERDAKQISKRTMKFLMESLGNNQSDAPLSFEFIDCCLGSPSVTISFM